MDISEIRQKYPQYADLPDEKLAQGFHQKFYSDIPYEEFSSKIGLNKTPPATDSDRVMAAVGGANKGISGLLGLPVDTITNALNLGIAATGTLRSNFPSLIGQTTTRANSPGFPKVTTPNEKFPSLIEEPIGGSDWIEKQFGKLGIATTNPRPDDSSSRMLNTGGMIAGSSLVPGVGPKAALTSAVGGALASESLGPEWTGVGAMSPSAIRQGGAGIKSAVAAKAAPIVETFKQAGTMPSVGQATNNTFLHGLENLAAKFPGGAGVMRKFIENQQKQIGMSARTGTPAESAGRAIEDGIKKDGGFLDRTKATWNNLDSQVALKIPKGSVFVPSNTVQALDELTTVIPGAQKTTGALVNSKIADIRDNLAADLKANNGKIPFEAIRSVRSKVGAMLDEALVSGIPGGEIKKLYGALSEDMKSAANAAGAGKEFARQNKYYSARMDRIESVLDRVIGKGKLPEDIFKTFYPTDPDQANKVRAVMRSLTTEERNVVSEAVANRLGRASPGKQLEDGELFSSETFLTNWNKLSTGAKAQLFPHPPMRENMNRLAEASSLIRDGKGIYANPDGPAGSFAAYSVYASPIAAIATGSVAPLVAAGTAAGTAYVGAKMITNPKIVEWLASPVSPNKPGASAAHLAKLAIIYNKSDDVELKKEISKFIDSSTTK
jgi:hypothetical protein